MGSLRKLFGKKTAGITAIVILAVMMLFYFKFDPMEWRFMPRCIFHELTGFECAGCGTQRMLHAMLHGRWGDAWEANPLGVVAIPFIAFLLWLETRRTIRPDLYRKVYSRTFIISVGCVIVGWTILRNLI